MWEISLRAVTWEPVVIEKMPGGLQIKAKSMIKLNGNGNSLVKLNGNGNSLVKLNGNDNGSNGSGAAATPLRPATRRLPPRQRRCDKSGRRRRCEDRQREQR